MLSPSMFRHGIAVLAASILIIVCISGCGRDRGPERVIVSGTVTYKGKPVADGMIQFIPRPTCPVPTSGATIVDGQYQVNGHGGVPVGTHGICIEGFHLLPVGQSGRLPSGGPFGEPKKQYLPKKYNVNTQLEMSIEPGSRTITKDFELTD